MRRGLGPAQPDETGEEEPAWIAVYAYGPHDTATWLRKTERRPAERLLDTVRLVLSWSPSYRFPLSDRWHLMRDDEGVDMTGVVEARIRKETWLYRLICRFDDRAPENGLPAKALVLVHAFRKPNESKTPTSELNHAIENWNAYCQRPRRASGPVDLPVDLGA